MRICIGHENDGEILEDLEKTKTRKDFECKPEFLRT